MPSGRDELNLELAIDRLAFGGDGIGTHEGKIYFVEGALPGERVLARVVQDKKNFGRAEIIRILQSSSQRIEPPCPHVRHCGGCQYQHLNYQDELRYKEEQVRDAFERNLSFARGRVQPIAHGTKPYGYRNSVTLHPTAKDARKPQRLGFVGRDNASPVVIEHCLLADERLKPVFSQKRLVAGGQTRMTFRLSETGSVLDDRSELYYRVSVAGRRVLTSSEGFFQNNLEVTGLIVERLLSWVEEAEPSVFYDLYAGVGTFSLALESRVAEIHAFEENASSLECLKINFAEALLKGTSSLIHKGRVEKTFPPFFETRHTEDAMIFMDPPRSGIAASLAAFLAQHPVRTLAYLSCDLPTLARDLKILMSEGNYEIAEVMPFDMFPRTKHIETLVRLNRKTA